LEDAGFDAESLPSIGLFDVLEHIEDDSGFLHSIYRLLIPGGRFYLTVPAYRFLWSDADEYAGHRRRYTLKALTAILQQAGFSIEYSTYMFWPLIFPILLYRGFPYKAAIRKKGRIEIYRGELIHPVKWVNRWLDRILGLEIHSIKRGKKIPFGAVVS
jgi:SAM-dependent methyltransferase